MPSIADYLFLSPKGEHIEAFKHAVQPQVKNEFKLGYEIEFATTKPNEVYNYIRNSGVRYVDAYTSRSTRYEGWQVKTDSSIIPPRGYTGVEVASPPMDLYAGIASLFSAFNYITHSGGVTNDSCGLHVSISFKSTNLFTKLNPLALMYNFDDEYYLKKWNREANRFCQAVKPAYSNWLRRNLEANPGNISRSGNVRELCSIIGQNIRKHHSINLIKLRENYIEFRLMGGADYHTKREQVLDTIVAILKAYDASVNAPTPDLFLKLVDSVEQKLQTKMEAFTEKMKSAVDRKTANRKLLGNIYEATNRMQFTRDEGYNRDTVKSLLDNVRTIINRDADPTYLTAELQNFNLKLVEIKNMKTRALVVG